MSKIFILDTTRCIGCSSCAIACMDQKDIQLDEGDTPFRVCFTVEQGCDNDSPFSYLTMACMHCEDAPCINSCPTGCLKKDIETGFTVYDNSNCIGCHSCAMACPFAAPCYDKEGKMVKCDGCIDRVRFGLEPACVRVCPYDAIQLVTKEEYENEQKYKKAKLLAYMAFDK
ncbi:MAG: 4Fe-4S binding protein [Clostridiales bacterium]|nr:4Fe-4S binding protein [Clostridiales bacterium]